MIAKAWWWGAAALALLGIGVALWPQARPAADSPSPSAQAGAQGWASPSPFALPASAAAAPAVAPPGASTPARAVTMVAPSAPLRPALPPVETPAESLRKVQLALGGGTPEEALAAAATLEFCKHAASIADSMHRGREELSPLVPPEIRKSLDKMAPPPATKEQMDRADQQQRSCQVFDAATLSRSGELLRKAYEGGAREAAQMYLLWLQGDGKDQATPALIATLQAQVRTSAESGDFMALGSAAFGSASALAATPVQMQAYRAAWLRMGEELNPGSTASTKNMFEALDELGRVQPLTAEQQREANALAQKIVDAWHARMHKGG
jgi:hypothetical protein